MCKRQGHAQEGKGVDPHLKLSSKVVTVVKTQFCFKFFEILIRGSKMLLVFNMSRTGPGLPKQGIAGRQAGRQASRGGSFGGLLRFVPPPPSLRCTLTQFCNSCRSQPTRFRQDVELDQQGCWFLAMVVTLAKCQQNTRPGPSSCHPRKWDGV